MITNVDRNLNSVFDVEDSGNTIDVKFKELSDSHAIVTTTDSHNSTDLVVKGETESEYEEENKDIKRNTEEDYNLARENIKNLIAQGEDLLETSISIATSSEDAKALSAANGILKTLAEMNKSLIELNRGKQDIYNNARAKAVIKAQIEEGTVSPSDSMQTNIQNITNNVVFTGSSSDLISLIRNTMKEKTEQIK